MLHVLNDISLKPYTTFGVDVKAAQFVVVKTLEDIHQLINRPGFLEQRRMVLGGGSNVLFCADFEGLVIKNELEGIVIKKEDDDFIWLTAFSGTNWHLFVLYCVGNGYGGLENLSLIPGTVGAAPMQNIGAYGVEIKDTFEELEAIEWTTGEHYKFDKETCAFGYRNSIFKNVAKDQFFIISVTFKLSKQPKLNTSYGDIQKILSEKKITTPSIRDVSDAVIAIRESKLPNPTEIGNAGSFFKNPEIDKSEFLKLQKQYPLMPNYVVSDTKIKIPAAWLIEQCGWKGKRVGNTGNHAKQALVIVNYGKATGNEIWQHALQVQQSVFNTFGISLEPEVNRIA